MIHRIDFRKALGLALGPLLAGAVVKLPPASGVRDGEGRRVEAVDTATRTPPALFRLRQVLLLGGDPEGALAAQAIAQALAEGDFRWPDGTEIPSTPPDPPIQDPEGRDLRPQDLSPEANLASWTFHSGADLGTADLRGARFQGNILRGVDLSACRLEGAEFVGVDLYLARLPLDTKGICFRECLGPDGRILDSQAPSAVLQATGSVETKDIRPTAVPASGTPAFQVLPRWASSQAQGSLALTVEECGATDPRFAACLFGKGLNPKDKEGLEIHYYALVGLRGGRAKRLAATPQGVAILQEDGRSLTLVDPDRYIHLSLPLKAQDLGVIGRQLLLVGPDHPEALLILDLEALGGSGRKVDLPWRVLSLASAPLPANARQWAFTEKSFAWRSGKDLAVFQPGRNQLNRYSGRLDIKGDVHLSPGRHGNLLVMGEGFVKHLGFQVAPGRAPQFKDQTYSLVEDMGFCRDGAQSPDGVFCYSTRNRLFIQKGDLVKEYEGLGATSGIVALDGQRFMVHAGSQFVVASPDCFYTVDLPPSSAVGQWARRGDLVFGLTPQGSHLAVLHKDNALSVFENSIKVQARKEAAERKARLSERRRAAKAASTAAEAAQETKDTGSSAATASTSSGSLLSADPPPREAPGESVAAPVLPKAPFTFHQLIWWPEHLKTHLVESRTDKTKSVFLEGTTLQGVKTRVWEVLQRPTFLGTNGMGGTLYGRQFDTSVGTLADGRPTNRILVVVAANGFVVTAYPIQDWPRNRTHP